MAAEQQKVANNLKTTEEKYKRTKVLWYITIGTFVIALIAAIIFATLYGQARTANSKQFDAGFDKGASEQKQKDADEQTRASLSDTRVYTAPKEYNAFSFQLPKSYSLVTNRQGKDVLVLLAYPDKVDFQAKEQAFRLLLRDELYTKVRDVYDKQAKDARSPLKAEEIKVSSRDAMRYVGKLDRSTKDSTTILVEYLDKTLIIQTDDNSNATFLAAYNSIINSLILP